jgi:repressor LexA
MARKIHELKSNEARALSFIRNRLVHRGTAPSVREVAAELGFQSPRSAAVVIDRLIELGFLRRRQSDRGLQLLRNPETTREQEATIEVPLVGSAACGAPLLAVENVEAMIQVSTQLAPPPHRYFLLRARGDSMTEVGIEDGNLVLVRQQETAEAGQLVVALVDDEATIKELRRSKDAVALMPRSKNPANKPIVLRRDFRVQGIVVATLPNVED